MASAIRDLNTMLAQLHPIVRPGVFVVVTVHPDDAPAWTPKAHAVITEDEGISLVIAQDDADRAGMPYHYEAAWITLTVHSALDAVGLTAAVATQLAHAGISCNVLAGYHHDHLLVPAARCDDTLAELAKLTASMTP